MASVYNLEPQPTAKVVLKTTSGDISLELFGKQTPLSTRNFLQHCLDGYYNNTIFHRLVPGFIIQGGDPTGTGSGGISAINDGEPFQDEFHSRLKFNRRGLLGMANEGRNSNGSQFFLTLGATPELQGNNTLFGRVEGDTIYNLMKMGEAELSEGDGAQKPLYPTKITGTEILVNPVEGMVARAREAPRSKEEDKRQVKKRKKPAGKNALSFAGEDEDVEGVDMPAVKKSKANPKMVAADDQDDPTALKERSNGGPPPKKEDQLHRSKSTSPLTVPQRTNTSVGTELRPENSPSSSPEPTQPDKSAAVLERTNAEIAALKASMKRNVDFVHQHKERPKSALEAMTPATSTRGRKRGKVADEKGALHLFNTFKKRLDGLPAGLDSTTRTQAQADGSNLAPSAGSVDGPTNGEAVDEEAELCDLHFIANCQSCRSWDDHATPDDGGEIDGEDHAVWMAHTLSFAKDTLGKDLEWKRKMDEIEVIDPREKAKALKQKGRKDRNKGEAKGS